MILKYNKFSFICVIFLTVFSLDTLSQDSLSSAPIQNPKIHHILPKYLPYNSFSKIECVVETADKSLNRINIFIHNSRERNFKEFPMYLSEGKYIFDLIPEMVRANYLYYFFVAEFSDYSIVAYPEKNPDKNPIRIRLKKRAKKRPASSSKTYRTTKG